MATAYFSVSPSGDWVADEEIQRQVYLQVIFPGN
jgi:hypothetical protein